MGDVLKPGTVGGMGNGHITTTTNNINTTIVTTTNNNNINNQTGNVLATGGQTGGIGQTAHTGAAAGTAAAGASGTVLTGDLDSSLASLAENLTINKTATAK